MEGLKERFLRTYANVPLARRNDVIYVVDDTQNNFKKPITWDVAYFEIEHEGSYANAILEGLNDLNLI